MGDSCVWQLLVARTHLKLLQLDKGLVGNGDLRVRQYQQPNSINFPEATQGLCLGVVVALTEWF